MGIKEELKPVPTSVVHSSAHTRVSHRTMNTSGLTSFFFFFSFLAFFSVLHLSHSVLLHPCCALLTLAFSHSVLPHLTEDVLSHIMIGQRVVHRVAKSQLVRTFLERLLKVEQNSRRH